MFKLAAFAVVFLAAFAAALPSYEDPLIQLFNKPGAMPSINGTCLVKYCAALSAKCGLDKGCREAVACSAGCFKYWDKDTSPQKFTVQNCTNKCTFTYGEEKVFKDYMGCLTDHDHACISFPPIPSTCKASRVKPVKQLTTKDFNGKWWVQRGYHKVYDCYPCQTIDIHSINATAWSYSPVYKTYLVNNSLYYVTNLHFVMPMTKPGEKIAFRYLDVGMDHFEEWWPIDKADDNSWIQMYYCGSTLQWNYEGALVLSKAKTILKSDYIQIAASYKQAVGLDLIDFCYVDTTGKNCMAN